jgi:FADH2 O2-dependent halogenase
MTERCQVAIVGSGFAGSLLARVLARLGYEVVLLERGRHPRFAIGESSTPLANLAMERIGARYGLEDCGWMAEYGRWMEHMPEVRRGLKRGFTYYRHHPDEPFADRGLESERLLVAASPIDAVADSHWLRSDVDHHLVNEAIRAGVDYRDRVELSGVDLAGEGVRLTGTRDGEAFDLRADFVVDASGPGGFLARHLPIEPARSPLETRSAIVFSHFEGVRPLIEVVPGLPPGPYPDERAAVHHLIDEGWIYALPFDHGVTSAGVLLTPAGLESLGGAADAETLWKGVMGRYPTLAECFGEARAVMPLAFRARVQHRLSRAAGGGGRWALLPSAYSFADPMFSTGIAWSLRAIERLALAFEPGPKGARPPGPEILARYDALLVAEADQADRLIAGSYEAIAHFDLFAAQAMIYFATVSFAEERQRSEPENATPWDGFLGVGDPVLEPLPRQSLLRLRQITAERGRAGTPFNRADFAAWVSRSIAPRNVAGLADAAKHNLYPVT